MVAENAFRGEGGLFKGTTDASGFFTIAVPQGEYEVVSHPWKPVVVRASETIVLRRGGVPPIPTKN